MSDLPPGWEWAELGELGNYWNGRAFKSSEWSESGRPIIRIQNLTGSAGRFNYYPGDVDERVVVRPGDLLVSWAATLGAYIWNGPEAVLNQHIFKVESFIDKKFHYYLLCHVLNDLVQGAHGSGMVHITRGRFNSAAVAVPPLAEQRRIVAALDQHFSCVDRGSELVFRPSVRLARLRETTLEHLDSELVRYESARLADLLREPLRNGHSAPAVQGPGLPTISITAVTKGEFLNEHVKNTSADPDRVRDLWLRRGDILVQRANTPELVGTSAMYDGPDGWAIFPDLLIRVRVNSEVLPEFVALTLKTRRVRDYFRRSAKGLAGSMPKIDQATVANTQIRVPPLDRQAVFVQQAKESADRVDRLLSACTGATLKARQLRASIYGEAFAGRLVEQDPADEPASELLARIRAQRVVVPKQRGRRTAKELAAPATKAIGTDFQQGELPL